MNPVFAEKILRSYFRNICTLASNKTIFNDVTSLDQHIPIILVL